MLKVEVMTHGYKQKLGSRPPPIEWLFTDSADWVPGLRKRVHAFHFSAASSTHLVCLLDSPKTIWSFESSFCLARKDPLIHMLQLVETFDPPFNQPQVFPTLFLLPLFSPSFIHYDLKPHTHKRACNSSQNLLSASQLRVLCQLKDGFVLQSSLT